MSRRSALSRVQSQARAASRMTVGTRMWSEQPIPRTYSRFVVPGEPPLPPLTPPSGMRYIEFWVDVGPGTPGQAMYATLYAGEQTLLIVDTSTDQLATIAAGWTILEATQVGGVASQVVTRTSLVNETVLVATTGPETHSWNTLAVHGFAFLGMSTYAFLPVIRSTGITDGHVTLYAWGGASSALRMRALTARGAYTTWDYPGAESGHMGLGFLNPRTSWWNLGTSMTPAEYLTAEWAAGTWTHPTIGVAGPLTYIEWHVELAAA